MSGYSAIGIVGSRDFPDEEMARKVIRKVLTQETTATIISGGARGPDTWGMAEAGKLSMAGREYRPDVEAHGGNFAAAALARNTEIAENADLVLAFWDGKSKGTKDTITKAMAARKDTIVVSPDGRFVKHLYGSVYGGFGD